MSISAVVWVLLFASVSLCDSFHEELSLSRLSSSNLAAHFRFVVDEVPSQLSADTQFFPSILSELIQKYTLSELHLALTRGNWQAVVWGMPPQPSNGQGAEIRAWFDHADNQTLVDERWGSLVNSLNGIFCTSLSSLHPTLTSSPSAATPRGAQHTKGTRALRNGRMAEETVCTENLTPWRKLLPCKQSGLVSLLNPLKIFDSSFHSLSFSVFLQCPDGATECFSPTWRLSLDATIVFDLPIQTRTLDWEVDGVFGRSMDGSCPVAHSSQLIVSDPFYKPSFNRPANGTKIFNGKTFHIFDLKTPEETKSGLAVRYEEKSLDVRPREKVPLVSVESSLLGGETGASGTLRYVVSNGSPHQTHVAFSSTVPWYAQLRYASLAIRCYAETGQESASAVVSFQFLPSLARLRPALLDVVLLLEPLSLCHISVRFDRAFMKMSEYPSDANHGKYIPPAVITLLPLPQTGKEAEFVQKASSFIGSESASATQMLQSSAPSSPFPSLYSSPLLLSLPVPDFSMPFNVEAFVCVVVSLCFTPLQYYSTTMMVPSGELRASVTLRRKLLRVFLYVITALALYAELNNITPNQMMRLGRKYYSAAIESLSVNATSPEITSIQQEL